MARVGAACKLTFSVLEMTVDSAFAQQSAFHELSSRSTLLTMMNVVGDARSGGCSSVE